MPETTLQKIADHVYWMTPGQPDRPALAAVVGADYTVMLDAGASPAHARLFLNALTGAGVPLPRYVVLTHWHWDHVFGAAEIGVPVIAHRETAQQLVIQAGYAWDNAALDNRVATGQEIAFCADDIKVELPEPRTVQIKLPEILFDTTLMLDLGGGVICHVQHVGGDHAADSCVIHVPGDQFVFLGDCLYEAIYAPVRHFTTERLFPVLDTVLAFDATQFVEGHSDTVMPRSEVVAMATKMRLAGQMVAQHGPDEAAIITALTRESGQPPDADTTEFIQSFSAGYTLR